MDPALWFFGRATIGWFIVFGVDDCDEAGCWIPFECGGCDGVGDFQKADTFAGGEAEIIWGVDLAEIAAVDIDGFGEWDGMRAIGWIFSEWRIEEL